ncbi:dTMP kinase [Mycoplasma sp. T363T]|uniref:Thymidylate kinase n=1 Tax=Mycoplasma bradburyae TaxID=2963128 RepID=A0AAW6HMX5_9MOLU|nr:dTMP kinase [Mycoplasma bradburyae]MDC4163209.1 dTMP kinase [Mycoplasma bradburyae]MDC4181823.1 dTMP kinase [Mycoplasma bradburyae]MDC4182524.1 dTMP kinase [Mycoplasma bradburyae]MDC4183197.1 dTMP kinase [Mycoplasma bradburyae]UTS70122.1 dTMP kinase [Mycoplasma bradburyae]
MKNKGVFIVIEGVDGSGKSSFIKRMSEEYSSIDSQPIIYSREPGGCEASEPIRELIMNLSNSDPLTEALLFSASRNEHIKKKIIPALNENKIVICDRFVMSSWIYQGQIKGAGYEKVKEINKIVVDGLEPDLTLIFDVEPEIASKRISQRSTMNHLDTYTQERVHKVRNAYLDIYKNNHNIKVINASLDLDQVYQQALNIITSFVKNHGSN